MTETEQLIQIAPKIPDALQAQVLRRAMLAAGLDVDDSQTVEPAITEEQLALSRDALADVHADNGISWPEAKALLDKKLATKHGI